MQAPSSPKIALQHWHNRKERSQLKNELTLWLCYLYRYYIAECLHLNLPEDTAQVSEYQHL